MNHPSFHDVEHYKAELSIYWPPKKPMPSDDALLAMSNDELDKLLKVTEHYSKCIPSLVSDPKERSKRGEERQKQVLDFLRSEPYSSMEVIALFLDMTLAGARKVVTRLVTQGFVIKDEVKWMGTRKVFLYGISTVGLYECLDDDEEAPSANRRYYRGKYSETYISHTLIGQKVRWHMTQGPKSGSGNWVSELLLPNYTLPRKHKDRWKKYPDAVLYGSSYKFKGTDRNLDVAIEIERRKKTPDRYKKIIELHINNIEKEHYDYVIYWVESERMVKNLDLLFKDIMARNLKQLSIDYGRHEGRKVLNHVVVRSYANLGKKPSVTA